MAGNFNLSDAVDKALADKWYGDVMRQFEILRDPTTRLSAACFGEDPLASMAAIETAREETRSYSPGRINELSGRYQ